VLHNVLGGLFNSLLLFTHYELYQHYALASSIFHYTLLSTAEC